MKIKFLSSIFLVFSLNSCKTDPENQQNTGTDLAAAPTSFTPLPSKISL